MTFTKDRWPIEVLLYIWGRMMPTVMVTLETTPRERHNREPQSSTQGNLNSLHCSSAYQALSVREDTK